MAGFLTAQRWISADGAPISVATYDLETVGVLAAPAYQAVGGQNLSPWSKRITAQCERLLRFEGEQTLPGDQVAPGTRGPAAQCHERQSRNRRRIQQVVR